MKEWLKRLAHQARVQRATEVKASFDFADGEGNYLIRLSTDGTGKAFYREAELDWPIYFTDEQIDKIENDRLPEVGDELVRQLREAHGKGQVRTANWNVKHDEDVRENEIDEKRTGTDNDVREHTLENDKGRLTHRRGTDKDVKEECLDGKYYSDRRDPDQDVKENCLEDGLYQRRGIDSDWSGADNDVKEHLLADARHGNPSDVIEIQLERARKPYAPGDPNLTVKAALNSLAVSVVTAKASPGEVVEAVSNLSKRSDLAELIALAGLGTSHRNTVSTRLAFHNGSVPVLAPHAAVLAALGASVSDTIHPSALADVVKAAATPAQAERTVNAISRLAKTLMGDDSGDAAPVRTSVSYTDKMQAVLAAQTERAGGDNLLAKDHVKAALSALAMASIESGATPKEVVAAVSDGETETLLAEVELARTESSVDARLTRRSRQEFWGGMRTASRADVRDEVVGWLADYAMAHNFASIAVVEAVRQAAKNPHVAEGLVNRMVKSQMTRNAAIQVTDEKVTTKRIICTVSDLGGLDPKSPDFEDQFRSRAIDIMQNAGFQVDPGTFTLTSVNVGNDGQVTASVESRFSKSFNADATAATAPAGMADISAGETPGPNSGESMDTPVGPMDSDVDTVITPAAQEVRAQIRKETLQRFAQMAPPGMTDPMGGAAGGAPGAPGGDGMGMSALTVPSADNPTDEPADTDKMPDGQKKPWGSICPQCGQSDVDLANGEGKCNSCGAQLKYTFNVEVSPGSDEDADKGGAGDEGAGPPPPLGPDAGLGAATAPAPGGGPGMGGPGMGGGAGAPPAGGPVASAKPHLMIRVAYETEPDLWLRMAAGDFDRASADRLPVGFICPQCGNRSANKHQNQTFCHGCGTISRTEVAMSKNDPTKVVATIKWLIP